MTEDAVQDRPTAREDPTTSAKKTGSGFRYDVFLCHNRLDKAMVKDIAETLQIEAGILFFLDEYSIPASVEFMDFIKAEMRRAASCAIFLGTTGWGPTHLKEAELALSIRAENTNFRIIPVMLPEADERMWSAIFGSGGPSVNWVRFPDLANVEARAKLLRAVQGKFDVKASGPDAVTPYFIRRQAALWEASDRKDASLLFRGQLLSNAQAVAATDPEFVSANANPFLLQSTAAERKRYRDRLVLAVAAAAIAIGLAGLAWWQRTEAIRSAQEALVRSLVANAPRSITFDRHDERAALLARQAYLIDRSLGGPSKGLVTAALADVLGTPYFSSALALAAGTLAGEISPTGSFVLAGDQPIRVFGPLVDADGPSAQNRNAELPKAVTAATFDRIRDVIWTCWEDGGLRVIDASNFDRTILSIPSFAKAVRALSVTRDGAFALGLSDDGVLTWIDIKAAKTRTWSLPGRIRAIEIAPTGDRAAVLADENGALSLYEIGSSQPVANFTQDAEVNSFAFGQTADDLIVGESHGKIWRWKPGDQEGPSLMASDERGSVDTLAISQDGGIIAAASSAITPGIRIWRTAAGNAGPDVIPGQRASLALRFTLDNRFLVSADSGGELRYWRLSGAGAAKSARPDTYQKLPLAGRLYSVVRNRATGEFLVGGDHGVLQAWSSAELDEPPSVLAPQLEAALLQAPDKERFIGENGRNYLLTGHVMQVAVSTGGKRVAIVDPYGFVVVIDNSGATLTSQLISPPYIAPRVCSRSQSERASPRFGNHERSDFFS